MNEIVHLKNANIQLIYEETEQNIMFVSIHSDIVCDE